MDVTEADREKAMFVLFPDLANQVDGYIGGLTFSDEAEANMLAVAVALAEEREKARAPFLRIAERLEKDRLSVSDVVGRICMADAAVLIRRAAEETT